MTEQAYGVKADELIMPSAVRLGPHIYNARKGKGKEKPFDLTTHSGETQTRCNGNKPFVRNIKF